MTLNITKYFITYFVLQNAQTHAQSQLVFVFQIFNAYITPKIGIPPITFS